MLFSMVNDRVMLVGRSSVFREVVAGDVLLGTRNYAVTFSPLKGY